ncbi:hypothetical protein ACHIPZ_28550 [Antrihabitans sp. NCIMB 15449]|uniref:FUSC family protein n=1 Tax=Antrihabitans spumae TaxID=3373370 RepID=A0ABW7JW50_9NOCA
MSVLQSVFGRWSAGIRASIAFGLPAVIAVAMGFPHQALIIFCGAFAVLYGEGQPYRARAGRVLSAGATILVAVGLGALAGDVVGGTAFADDLTSVQLVEVVVLTAVAVFGTYVNDAGQLGPPGSFFFVLVCSIGIGLSSAGVSTASILVCTAIGVGSSLVVSMAGVVRDPRKPERTAVLRAVELIDAYVGSVAADRGDDGDRSAAAAALWNAWAMVHAAGLPTRDPESELLATLQRAHRAFAGAVDRLVPVTVSRPQRCCGTPTFLSGRRASAIGCGARLHPIRMLSAPPYVSALRVCSAAGSALPSVWTVRIGRSFPRSLCCIRASIACRAPLVGFIVSRARSSASACSRRCISWR